MKTYHVTIVYNDGLYSHIQNLKAVDKMQAFGKALNDCLKDREAVVSITVIEKRVME